MFERCGEPISIGVSTAKALLGQPGLAEVIFGQKDTITKSEEEIEFVADSQLYPEPVLHDIADIHVDSKFPQVEPDFICATRFRRLKSGVDGYSA